MSHNKERKDKHCLNCHNRLHGRFCHVCGQENIEPKETVWHLISHFFQDITHFDGKFFATLKLLVIRPGFLSKEYMIGRRAGYINPVRMYIFTSAFFFLLFFNFFKSEGPVISETNSDVNGKKLGEIARMDSASFADFTRNINREDGKKDIPMTRDEFKRYFDSSIDKSTLNIAGIKYRSRAEYDSLLQTGTIQHGWVKRQFIYKVIAVKEKYRNNTRGLINAFKEHLLHSLPQMLFISLPLLALLLKLLYYRRKEFYYVDHAIFSIHLYIFVFIGLLFAFCVEKINAGLGWGVLTFINGLIYFGFFFYSYKAMRKFYMQRRAKTILKFLLLHSLFLIVLLLLFTIFIFFSFLTI